jgi:hypothetical protein
VQLGPRPPSRAEAPTSVRKPKTARVTKLDARMQQCCESRTDLAGLSRLPPDTWSRDAGDGPQIADGQKHQDARAEGNGPQGIGRRQGPAKQGPPARLAARHRQGTLGRHLHCATDVRGDSGTANERCSCGEDTARSGQAWPWSVLLRRVRTLLHQPAGA